MRTPRPSPCHKRSTHRVHVLGELSGNISITSLCYRNLRLWLVATARAGIGVVGRLHPLRGARNRRGVGGNEFFFWHRTCHDARGPEARRQKFCKGLEARGDLCADRWSGPRSSRCCLHFYLSSSREYYLRSVSYEIDRCAVAVRGGGNGESDECEPRVGSRRSGGGNGRTCSVTRCP